jgi:hypothetical protein
LTKHSTLASHAGTQVGRQGLEVESQTCPFGHGLVAEHFWKFAAGSTHCPFTHAEHPVHAGEHVGLVVLQEQTASSTLVNPNGRQEEEKRYAEASTPVVAAFAHTVTAWQLRAS